MITQVAIKRFKSHKDVTLAGLGRINLLLGRNNSGKSAALEAILYALLPQNPKAVFELLNESRGITQNVYVWKSVFHRFDLTQPVEIVLNSHSGPSTMRILPMIGNKPVSESSGAIGVGLAKMDPDGLLFVHMSGQQRLENTVSVRQGRGERSRNKQFIDTSPAIFIPARERFNAHDAARRFDSLKQKKQHHLVVDALNLIDKDKKDKIESLESLATDSGIELFADIKESQLIPLSWMGDGMLRILGIVSALAYVKDGVLLVDEIENGLHFSVMENLWRTVVQTARDLNVQVFAATHNDEMIGAALAAVSALKVESEIRAYRFDLVNRETRVTDYDARLMVAARESEQEIR